jgi:hypothetical protein
MPADLTGKIVLRWDSTANCAPLLQPGGIDTVWLRTPADGVAEACRAAGAEVFPADAIRLASLEEYALAKPGETVAAKAGLWPGAQAGSRGGDGAVEAGATRQAWVTANGYLAAWLRAMYPERDPVLGYAPDKDAGVDPGRVLPSTALELALVDAWSAGGNFILAPETTYRDALLAGDKASLAAWTHMGQTARWLKQHRALFVQKPMDTVTALIDAGDASREIASLLFRHSLSPALVPAAHAPAPDPARRSLVVAAGLAPLAPPLQKLLLAHARAGATVVIDDAATRPWWRAPGLKLTHTFEDREVCKLGAGGVVAYKDPITDPGEFALDMVDLIGDRRPARVWNLAGGVVTASQAAPGVKAALQAINYGSPARSNVLVRRYGNFQSATVLRPDDADFPLRVYKRGSSTEVMLPSLNRVAVVVFD